MGVSGSKFSTTPVYNAPPIKDRAKFAKVYSTRKVSDIIKLNGQDTAQPKPNPDIK